MFLRVGMRVFEADLKMTFSNAMEAETKNHTKVRNSMDSSKSAKLSWFITKTFSLTKPSRKNPLE